MYDGLFPGIQQAFPYPPRQHCPGRITADVAGDSLILNALSRAEGKSILGKLGLASILYSYVIGSQVVNEEVQDAEAKHNEMLGTDMKSLSSGRWQKISIVRGFLASDEADLVAFERVHNGCSEA